VAFAVIFGVIQGGAAFAPKVSVATLLALDPLDPFSTPFVLSNDGVLSIHSVEYACVINHVTPKG